MEEVLDTEEKIIRARYHDALSKSMEAQEELETALRAMHEIGEYPPPPKGLRFPPDDAQREGTTHTMRIGLGKEGIKGYVTTGVYSDGTLGEIFIKAEKEGSFVSGLMDSFATVFSIGLQSGVPLDRLISKLRFTRFEPAGFTKNPEIHSASSVLDYLAQWLVKKYSKPIKQEENDGESIAIDTIN